MSEIDARPLTADSTRLPATYGLTLHWVNEGFLMLILSRAQGKNRTVVQFPYRATAAADTSRSAYLRCLIPDVLAICAEIVRQARVVAAGDRRGRLE